MWWTPSKRKIFEVRSFFRMLSSSGTDVVVTSFLWRSIWKVSVPLRVGFFMWTVTLGKILTFNNLCKKGIIVVKCCFMCKRSGEFVNHLLLHCEVA